MVRRVEEVAVAIIATLSLGLVFGCGWYLVDFMVDVVGGGRPTKPGSASRAFRAGAIATCVGLVLLIVADPF